ncbi:HAMP domain-containing sensor histidine kinase [Aliiglaciecola sp. LCG003]|uniref:sensor histidine kinase n=1 Tax=Aliiglaciecola sp. LCG003 TaxID=3053655 RepID=UPI0025728AF1|nr:HAMP domain-containing sensor histidine kinase [Aliiglaciecola sp. LCG003]WJG08120.1 HAMP domain-containing sensor histidine kinase [Aliiglaciecola sp. LCG003]
MQFGSLRQLTLLSFLVALIPLAVLLWHSQSSLTKMAKIAASEAQFSVDMARQIGAMENIAIDVERLIRQYHVLKKPELQQLTESYIQRLLEKLQNVCFELPDQFPCQSVENRVQWFKTNPNIEDPLLLDAQLAEFRRAIAELHQQVDALLDERIEQQQEYVNSVQQTQAWSTGILATFSLLLIVFASQLILSPVAKIERIIGEIAKQSEVLPGISKSGPKELIEVEYKLHWLADRLNQLEHLRHALLRHASHELKTPLASIKEGCSLLTECVVGPLNDQQKEVLSLLNSSTDRLNLLIEQLLDYNLLLQQAKPVYEKTDTKQLFTAVLTDNALAIQQNHNQVNIDIKVDSMLVDPNLYRRILDNLVSNALAHGSIGRPIDIKLYRQADMWVLDVANRGQKIPMELRKSLFEPFKRGDNRRNDRVIGSGLGLSIVADCARMMHGTANIVDVDYADVCMRVSLPLSEGLS